MINERLTNIILDEVKAMRLGTSSVVAANYYETTVFGSQRNYDVSLKQIENKVIDPNRKKMVNTPLIVEPGPKAIYNCQIGQGVGFGFVFVDYRTNLPLMCVACNKTNNGYTYKSSYYNKTTSLWQAGQTIEQVVGSIKELTDFCAATLSVDMDFFVES